MIEELKEAKATPDFEATLTPAMRQYRAAKQAHPDALMFFRMGDFYELFFEDAVVASRELQLTLTARDKARAVPMCGVPYHAAEGYLHRLLRRGFRVAVCEQMEDPKLAKGVVKREVTRVLTPGTAIDPALGAGESCWLAAIGRQKAGTIGLALVDLSTGEFRATEFAGEAGWAQALDELGRVRPVELLYGAEMFSSGAAKPGALRFGEAGAGDAEASPIAGLEAIRTKTAVEEWSFHPEAATPRLLRHFGLHSLDGLGLGGHGAAAGAAGAVLEYLERTKQGALEHIDALRFYERSTCLELDAVTVRNLELVEPLFAGEGVQMTLLWTLDACQTPMGKRLLRATLLRPLYSVAEIEARLEAVGEAAAKLMPREELRRSLEGVLDLERLLGRVALDSAGPREVLALARTLARLPGVRLAVEIFQAARWREFVGRLDSLEDVAGLILGTLAEEPPHLISEAGTIRAGVSAELDELRALGQNGRQAVAAIEERERARTGIGSLKVRFNYVFGYYIEVTRANARAVPADYERKQTLVNAERFTTPELEGSMRPGF